MSVAIETKAQGLTHRKITLLLSHRFAARQRGNNAGNDSFSCSQRTKKMRFPQEAFT
jgi:hypothetical protein